jgi:hypothetical protein
MVLSAAAQAAPAAAEVADSNKAPLQKKESETNLTLAETTKAPITPAKTLMKPPFSFLT